MNAQRRLAAILAADVVGYTRLMAADEAGTLAALKTRRKGVLEPLVAKHHGRVFKIAGDGVLVEFASAVNAVQCAVELQQEFAKSNLDQPEDRQIVLRIGVHVGDVMVEGSDLYGDGINIAARLEAIADPGSIFVSATARDHVGNRVSASFDDLGPQSLKNIDQEVRAFRVVSSASLAAPAALKQTERPSIAVLPFANMSGDPEQEIFADGLTEDITTALSRYVRFSVIARTSSFAYKGRSKDIKQIARELDASFVLEGSVRLSANRVRVNVQLIDGGSGAHLWAEKYDGDLDDVFDFQDQITRSVAAVTGTAILSSINNAPKALELIRSPANRLAYEAGTFLFQMTSEGRRKAEELAEKALAIDPDCALAHHRKVNAFLLGLCFDGIPHTRENVERGVALARETLRRSPNEELAHWLLAFALSEAGRPEEAIAELDTGLAINPSASMLLGDKGDNLILMGRTEEGIALCELALRLNPRDPIRYWWENCIATAHLINGRTEAARDLSRRSALSKPDHIRASIVWAAAAGELGIADEAREVIHRCLTRFPDMTLSNVIPHYHLAFVRTEDNHRLLDGLRKAGLPE